MSNNSISSEIRYILADIECGANLYDYRQRTDPASVKAIELYDQQVRAMNARWEFERRRTPDGVKVVDKINSKLIDGVEVVLSTDRETHEVRVRELMAEAALAGDQGKEMLQSRSEDSAVSDAIERIEQNINFINPYAFDTVNGTAEGKKLVYKDTKIPVHGGRIRLSTDQFDEESVVRSSLLDILLGGDIDFYRSITTVLHAVEAVRRFDAGVKITNIDRFEKKPHNGGMVIAYKGTTEPVDWTDIRLSTDPVYDDDELRYAIADIALGGNPEFYKRNAHVDNSVEIINSDHFERRDIPGKGMVVVHKGTSRVARGMDIQLNTDSAAS